jgi:hypothetical protein
MKHKFMFSFLFLMIAFSAFARLGDTFPESTKRFGKPLHHTKDKYAEYALFEYKGFVIFVRYRNGRSFSESYVVLAPGIKDKLVKMKFVTSMMPLLNEPKNLVSMTEKQRTMLRKANLKAPWKMEKIKGNGIEEMSATLGQRKVTGDYYIRRKVLVVTETPEPSAPQAPISEVKQAKAMCLPPGAGFKQFVKKYGVPFRISRSQWAGFQDGNNVTAVYFNNKPVENDIQTGRKHKTYKYILGSMNNAISCKIQYMTPSTKALKKLEPLIQKDKDLIRKTADKNKLTEAEAEYFSFSDVIDILMYYSLDSLCPSLLSAYLEGTSGTKWQSIHPESIEELRFETWKDGRRMYGSYDIVKKSVSIEYGIHPDDYKPEVIKKLKAKKEAETMSAF